MALAAPLAQSMTMRWPSSERSGTAASRERMYSARSASLTGGGTQWSDPGLDSLGCRIDRFEAAEDFGFDGEFGGVGKLVSVGAEELDAVVLPGIVRGGDDDAGGKAVRAGEEGDGGSGNDARALDGRAAGGQARGQRGGDPVGGLARVLSDEDARRIAEVMRQREADGVDGGGVERGLAGDAANAVGAKELLHQIFLHIYYQAYCTIWRIAARRSAPFGSNPALER